MEGQDIIPVRSDRELIIRPIAVSRPNRGHNLIVPHNIYESICLIRLAGIRARVEECDCVGDT